MARRIGIYAGTFDPVHAGHIAFGLAAQRMCLLNEVVFIPDRVPWRKKQTTDISHRVTMLRAATAGQPGLHVITLKSSQFSVEETLPEIRSIFESEELTFLLGSDVARHLHTWPKVDVLFKQTALAIGMRQHDSLDSIRNVMLHLQTYHNLAIDYSIIYTDFAATASSSIRSGAETAALHPKTSAYIREQDLYTSMNQVFKAREEWTETI